MTTSHPSPDAPRSPEQSPASYSHAALQREISEELSRVEATLTPVLSLRHQSGDQIFPLTESSFSSELPIADQLYAEPTYNGRFFAEDIGTRKGGDYHQTVENHSEAPYYRQEILHAAQALGFVGEHVATAPEGSMEHFLGIQESDQEKIDEKVAAVVVCGAAGMANPIRIYDAMRNITSGVIDTDRIIITTGQRQVNEAEKGRVKAPLRAGDTEFESMRLAAEDLLSIEFPEEADTFTVSYGTDLEARRLATTAQLGEKTISVEIIEAPFDPTRKLPNGTFANRANTEETLYATLPSLGTDAAPVVIESHDTWKPWQKLIGQSVYSVEEGRRVYAVGARNANRLFVNDSGDVDMYRSEDVVDEMIKYQNQLINLYVQLENAKQR